MKMCLVCKSKKQIKKEDSSKKLCVNCIHEYNYSCYECLDNMKKQKEKQLLDIYEKMKQVGII